MLTDNSSSGSCGDTLTTSAEAAAEDDDEDEDENDATVESPLLRNKSHSFSEENNNNSNNNNNHTSAPKNISNKSLTNYTAVDTTCNSPLHRGSATNTERRDSINLNSHTSPNKLDYDHRSNSTTLHNRFNADPVVALNHSNAKPQITIADTNQTPTNKFDQYKNICSNYNNTKDTNSHNPQNYSSTNTTNTHTHSYSLYPKDSFSSLEGKAPRQPNKMQTKVDAVGRVTGEWGRWQLRTVLLIFLCKIPSSWFMACIIFTAPSPRHGEFFCKPPPAVGAKNDTLWIKVSHPQKEELDDKEFTIDFCNVYQDAQEHAHHYYHYEQRELEPKVWEEPLARNANVIPCTQFEHKAEFHSVVTQYDLVCSRDILVSVTQFFHLFGVLTGGILANHLLKYFSPRNVMLFGMITQIICGNLTGHVASYELHVFFRCLSAVCCAQMYTAGGMIMADITGGKYKTYVSTLFEQFWSIGVMLLPGVSSFFSSWSHLYMAISWPTVILIYLWQWIPDSPRWMIARGRVLEAKKILLQCVEINGTQYSLPYNIDQQLQLQAQTAMDAPPPAGWWTLWKGERAIRHMICVHLAWAIYIVVYYGMLLNIRSFSREHLEVNTAVAGLCEMIGTFIGLFLIVKTTRKWLWTGLFNVVAGCIAYMGWLVPEQIPIDARVALLMLSAMVSKTAISTTLSILTTCTVELVSDEKKKICSFSTICWARFWLLGAPFIGATVIFGQLVPQTAFASLAIIGGISTAFISSPRTLPKEKSTHSANNMAQATQMTNIGDCGIDNKGFTKGATPHTIFTSITKMTTPNSNLPPQLLPGIWTTKSHEDNPHV